MPAVRTALIIGGGIAGPAAAVALRRAGVESVVYEARTDRGPRADSAPRADTLISLWPNGVNALDVIGAAGAVRRSGWPAGRLAAFDNRGRLVGTCPLPSASSTVNVRRTDLFRALADLARAEGVPIRHGKHLVAAEQTPDGVVATFADGSTATGDILVGADGVHSTARVLIDPEAPVPRYLPQLELSGVADMSVPENTEALCGVLGRRGSLAFWPRPDHRTEWFARLPLDRALPAGRALGRSAAECLEQARRFYADDPFSHRMLTRTDPDQVSVIGSTVMLPSLPVWHRGRMVLVGDAAHAPSSASGQGGALALESAIELARCLRDLPTLDVAFRAYQRLRRPHVETIAAQALRAQRERGTRRIPNALLRLVWPIATRTFAAPAKTMNHAFHHRIDWHAAVPAALAENSERHPEAQAPGCRCVVR
ncbi:FAD-dependent monooxygenase [Spirillospora sp. NPDC052269]